LQAICAQRLTASEVWAHWGRATPFTSLSVLNALRHQRFGHYQEIGCVPVMEGVLNALRHQRFGHLVDQRLKINLLLVLNALRHQRFGHVDILANTSARDKCSTPYGIRGLGTTKIICAKSKPLRAQRLTASEVWAPQQSQEVFVKPRVLNALRHQRFGHPRSANSD